MTAPTTPRHDARERLLAWADSRRLMRTEELAADIRAALSPAPEAGEEALERIALLVRLAMQSEMMAPAEDRVRHRMGVALETARKIAALSSTRSAGGEVIGYVSRSSLKILEQGRGAINLSRSPYWTDSVALYASPQPTVDDLAQEIRRVDGNHDMGAGALAEALMAFLYPIDPATRSGREG